MITQYPRLVIRAIELAAQWHDGQWRKHPHMKIPYVAHPFGVALLLSQAGYDDETVAAGALHDVIEDCDVTKDDVAAATTPRVAELVDYVSEDKGLPWEERKAAYRERLESAPVEALAICCADHIYNMHSLVDSARTSDNVWAMFNVGKTKKLENERLVLDMMERRLDSPLVKLHSAVLEEVQKLPD